MGALIVADERDTEALGRVLEWLRPKMFADAALRLVCAAVLGVRRGGLACDPATLFAWLEEHGDLDGVGGPDAIADIVERTVTAANLEYHAGLVREAWERREIAELGRSIERAGGDRLRPVPETWAWIRERAAEAVPAAGMGGSTFATLAALQANPLLLAAPECVVPRLAYRGRLIILAGPDKIGKSELLAHASAKLTLGHSFLGGPTLARWHRVVLVGLEEALGDAVRRLTLLDADPANVQLLTLAQPDLLDGTRALLAGWPADWLVVDSLTEYARVTVGAVPEDGDNSGWSAVVRPLSALCRALDVAVTVIHHTRRSDGQFRGAGEIAATADAILEMFPAGKDEDPGERHIKGRGRWTIEPFSVALHEGRYELSGGAKLSVDALIILHVEAEPGCSLRSVRERVGGRTEVVGAALRQLVARGAIEDRGTGDRMALFPVRRGLL